jgi:hypothetical protein
MAEDAKETPGRPVISVGLRVRVLAATALGILPRLATGCGEAIKTAFDPRTREYTAKALALYSRPQTKIPETQADLPGPLAGKVAERESSKRSRAGDAASRGGRAGSGEGSAAREEK